MAGYLEHYGAGDERRSRNVKRALLAFFIVGVVAVVAFVFFHNRRQKLRVEEFGSLLQRKDYKAAHALWGCTDSHPCPNYSFDKFLADWGPESKYRDVQSVAIIKSRACGSGVIVTADFGNQRSEILWVEGPELAIGFSPWPVCPPR
jgi:hypothetical protein